jgi:hypothetical protein
MTTLKQAAQLALEALEMLTDCYDDSAVGLEIDAIKALRAALADHNEEVLEMVEPVAWAMSRPDGLILDVICPDEHDAYEGEYTVPLYAAPRPAKREPLTDEEIDRVTDAQWARNNHKPIYAAHRAYARAIEDAIWSKT